MLYEAIIAVELHFELFDLNTAHVCQQGDGMLSPFRVTEEGGMAARNVAPQHIDRAKDNEPYDTAHMVALANGDSHTLGVNAALPADVVLQTIFATDELIANLGVETDGEALLIIFIIAAACGAFFVFAPLKIFNLRATAFLHHTLIAHNEHAGHHAYLTNAVATVAHCTVIVFITLGGSAGKRIPATIALFVPLWFLIQFRVGVGLLPILTRVVFFAAVLIFYHITIHTGFPLFDGLSGKNILGSPLFRP